MDVRVTVYVKRDGKDLRFTGQASDVCQGGLSAHIPTDLVEGEILGLEFTLPYSRLPLRAEARVSNRNGFRYGLEFRTLTSEQREGIQRLCDTLTLLEG